MTHQDHKHVTVSGEKWFLFCAEYLHEGRTFSFEFHARTSEEAIEMLRSIRCGAVDCHQIYAQIKAPQWAAFFVQPLLSAYCWIRNLSACLLFLAIASTAIAAPKKPSPATGTMPQELPEVISREDIVKTLLHIQELTKEQRVELDLAKATIATQGQKLDGVLSDLGSAKDEVKKVQDSLNAERAARAKAEQERDEERAAKEAALVKVKKESARAEAEHAHVSEIKTWMAVLLAGFFVILVQQLPFSWLINPAWSMGARIGASAAAIGAAWLIVARFV